MCVCVCVTHQSCLTHCISPGSSVRGNSPGKNTGVVAITFSRGSSWLRDQTQVSSIAGRFFTIWATRSDQSLSRVRLFASPWIAARQASLSIINSRSSLRLTSIESVMPSSHLIVCRPLLLLPPIPPSIRVFSNESTLRMRWPKYWSFSFRKPPYILYRIHSNIQMVPGVLDEGHSCSWKKKKYIYIYI